MLSLDLPTIRQYMAVLKEINAPRGQNGNGKKPDPDRQQTPEEIESSFNSLFEVRRS